MIYKVKDLYKDDKKLYKIVIKFYEEDGANIKLYGSKNLKDLEIIYVDEETYNKFKNIKEELKDLNNE